MRARILGWVLCLVLLSASVVEARTYLFSINTTYTDSITLWGIADYGNLGTRAARLTGWFVLNVDPWYQGTPRVEWLSLNAQNMNLMSYEVTYLGYVAQAYVTPNSVQLDFNNCSMDGAMPMTGAHAWDLIDNLNRYNQQTHLVYNMWYYVSGGLLDWGTTHGDDETGSGETSSDFVPWHGAFTTWPASVGNNMAARVYINQANAYQLSIENGLIFVYVWGNLRGSTVTSAQEPTSFRYLGATQVTVSSANLTFTPTAYLQNTVPRYAPFEGGYASDVSSYGSVLNQGLNDRTVGGRFYRSGDTPPGYTNQTTSTGANPYNWGFVNHTFNIPGTYAGTYQVQYNFAGETNYGSSGSVTQITVYNDPTVTYTGSTSFGTTTLSLQGQFVDAAGQPVSGRTIVWTLDGTTYTASGVTNGSGVATATMTATGGTFDLSTDYSAANFYLAAFDDDPITVVPEPASVALMLGGLGLAGMMHRASKKRKKKEKK